MPRLPSRVMAMVTESKTMSSRMRLGKYSIILELKWVCGSGLGEPTSSIRYRAYKVLPVSHENVSSTLSLEHMVVRLPALNPSCVGRLETQANQQTVYARPPGNSHVRQ